LPTGGKDNRAEIATRVEALKDVMSRLPQWGLQAIGAYFAYISHPFGDVASELVSEKLAKEAGVVCLPGVYFGEGTAEISALCLRQCRCADHPKA
jgi:aspartate/methionine/tyrosine aminotransferase